MKRGGGQRPKPTPIKKKRKMGQAHEKKQMRHVDSQQLILSKITKAKLNNLGSEPGRRRKQMEKKKSQVSTTADQPTLIQ
jgi:hypothetical protein